jgi:hypothetical protein
LPLYRLFSFFVYASFRSFSFSPIELARLQFDAAKLPDGGVFRRSIFGLFSSKFREEVRSAFLTVSSASSTAPRRIGLFLRLKSHLGRLSPIYSGVFWSKRKKTTVGTDLSFRVLDAENEVIPNQIRFPGAADAAGTTLFSLIFCRLTKPTNRIHLGLIDGSDPNSNLGPGLRENFGKNL